MGNYYIGVDIVRNKRVDNKKFVRRFLTDGEYNVYLSFLSRQAAKDFVAGRWAAKEAIIKATNKSVSMEHIEILNEMRGLPIVFINGTIRKDIKITISHEKKYTVAFCFIAT